MLIPTLSVDEATCKLFEDYLKDWEDYFDKGLADYNISHESGPVPEWYERLEFSNCQRKFALHSLATGLQVIPCVPESEEIT